MVIIGTTCYPPSSATEIGKRFQEATPLPDFITRRGPYITSQKGDGIQGFTIFECDNDKLAEAFTSVGNYYLLYKDVPGYTYSVDVLLEAHEGLSMIGLG